MNWAENNLSAIDKPRVSLLWHDNLTSHEMLCDGIQDAVCWLNGNTHHQDLRLERPKIDANSESKPGSFVVIWNADYMPAILSNVCKHLHIRLVGRLT